MTIKRRNTVLLVLLTCCCGVLPVRALAAETSPADDKASPWLEVRSVKMQGRFKVFWNVGGGAARTGPRELSDKSQIWDYRIELFTDRTISGCKLGSGARSAFAFLPVFPPRR